MLGQRAVSPRLSVCLDSGAVELPPSISGTEEKSFMRRRKKTSFPLLEEVGRGQEAQQNTVECGTKFGNCCHYK